MIRAGRCRRANPDTQTTKNSKTKKCDCVGKRPGCPKRRPAVLPFQGRLCGGGITAASGPRSRGARACTLALGGQRIVAYDRVTRVKADGIFARPAHTHQGG